MADEAIQQCRLFHHDAIQLAVLPMEHYYVYRL